MSFRRHSPPGLVPDHAWSAIVRDLRNKLHATRANLSKPLVNPRPVLILGNQKSGTSVIAHLLALATDLPATVDLQREIQRLRYVDLIEGHITLPQFVAEYAPEFSAGIVKEPSLTFFIPQLLQYYPQADLIFVVRDPRDNIRSILDRLHLPADADRLPASAINALPRAWQLNLVSPWITSPSAHYIHKLAQRWKYFARAYLDHADRLNLVRYEDFMNDRQATIEALCRLLGLRVVADIGPHIPRAYQPAGPNRGRPIAQVFGPRNLARVLEVCAPEMEDLSYEP